MAAGIQYNKAQLDAIAGALAQQFKRLMEQSKDFKDYLDSQSDASLTGLGYSTADIATLRGGAGDMALLVAIANAQATQSAPQDFTTNTRQLWGVGF